MDTGAARAWGEKAAKLYRCLLTPYPQAGERSHQAWKEGAEAIEWLLAYLPKDPTTDAAAAEATAPVGV